MARNPSKKAYRASGRFYARLALANGDRRSIALPTCKDTPSADKRAALLGELATRLRASGHGGDVAYTVLEGAAKAEGRLLEQYVRRIDDVVAGRLLLDRAQLASTIQGLGEQWTSGELARLHPDHIRSRGSVASDIYRLNRHVYPVIGNVQIAEFTVFPHAPYRCWDHAAFPF